MNKYFSNKKLIGILISVIAIAALIALSVNRSSNVNPIQQTVNDITAIAGRVVAAPVNAVNRTFDAVDNLVHTYQENKQLKSQIRQTDELQAQLNAVRAEQAALEEELGLKESLSDFDKIHTTVISRSPDSWVDQLVVDRGSQDGVERGMAVMSQNGLIGRVTEVSPLSSKVTLMTTADQRDNLVSAEIQVDHPVEESDQAGGESAEETAGESQEVVHGVVEGYHAPSNRLIMEQITSNADLQEGQTVYTSGLSGLTPHSLIIGTIDEVTSGDFGLTQRVYIQPAANFDDIRYATIIKRRADRPDPGLEEENEPAEEDESGNSNGED